MLGLFGWMLGWIVLAVTPPELGPRPPAKCSITIRGLPTAAARNHTLEVDGHSRTIDKLRLPLRFSAERVAVQVLGPRFSGARTISHGECSGDGEVELLVRPLPARIEFRCGPKQLTVACKKCPFGKRRIYLPDKFPAVPVAKLGEVLVLVLRAPGYRRTVLELRVMPGHNIVHVNMKPL